MACNSSRRVLLASCDLLDLLQDSTTRATMSRCFCTRRCAMRLMICPRLLRSMLLLGALVWLGTAPAGTARASGTWQVVLAAGDDAEPVFDNATRELGRRLATAGAPPGHRHLRSASSSEPAAGAEPATAELLLRRIADLPARPWDQCLIFLTSHGERGSSVELSPGDP